MTYQDLLAAAQQNPVEADFHSLRMSYTRSPLYNPYARDTENLKILRAAMHEGDMEAALNAVAILLETNYVDIEAHITADYIYTRLGDETKMQYHRQFARGLIDSIFNSGDGREPDSAFIVIDVAEEYVLMQVMGYRPSGQALLQHEGHWIDALDALHGETGQKIKVYFNIDLPKNWLRDHLTGEQSG
jgi:hypothetical protein